MKSSGRIAASVVAGRADMFEHKHTGLSVRNPLEWPNKPLKLDHTDSCDAEQTETRWRWELLTLQQSGDQRIHVQLPLRHDWLTPALRARAARARRAGARVSLTFRRTVTRTRNTRVIPWLHQFASKTRHKIICQVFWKFYLFIEVNVYISMFFNYYFLKHFTGMQSTCV